MRALKDSLWRCTFARYFASSGVALGADTSVFVGLVAIGAPAGPASAAAYSFGIVVHWLVASRAVFIGDLAEQGPARTRQKMLFVLSALAGLAVTTAIVSAGAALSINLAVAKFVAIGLSFTTNWLIRRWIVFRPQPVAA